jgi:Flp pilus assembly protein TadD
MEAFGRGDARQALARFDEALKAAPGDAETLVDRAVALDALGRLDDAVAAGGLAVAAAEAAYQTERTELLPSALSSRASLLLKQGRKDLAARDLRRAYELAPETWPLREETKRRLDELEAR